MAAILAKEKKTMAFICTELDSDCSCGGFHISVKHDKYSSQGAAASNRGSIRVIDTKSVESSVNALIHPKLHQYYVMN